jgi:peptide/nickel transport system permease protein
MAGYLARRLGQTIVVLIGVTIIAFVLRALIPGNLARYLDPHAGPTQIVQIDKTLGLNEPLWRQYLKFLDQLLHGNLGYSYVYNQTVASLLQHEVLRDVILIGLSTVIAIVIAVPIGLVQAVRRNTGLDYTGAVLAFFFYAIPDFVLGIILLSIFAIHFHVFQGTAPQGSITSVLKDFFPGLTLPLVTEILVGYAAYSRYMRSASIDSLTQDYIRTARAKGLSQRQVVTRHVLRNSLIPMVTLVGLSIPGILVSGLLIENVFNFEGMGYQVVQSATNGDYQTVLAITVIIAAVTVVGNLLADIAYGLLDPRIRY